MLDDAVHPLSRVNRESTLLVHLAAANPTSVSSTTAVVGIERRAISARHTTDLAAGSCCVSSSSPSTDLQKDYCFEAVAMQWKQS